LAIRTPDFNPFGFAEVSTTGTRAWSGSARDNDPETGRLITELVNGPGTIIGGFCNSGACLARFLQ